MKAAVLEGPGQMVIRDIPPPTAPGGDEVLIKVAAVGVCGSDRHCYQTGHIGNQVITYPFVISHEFSGTVAAVGDRVKHLSVGDRVAVDPAISCGHCRQCAAGRFHTCENIRFLGYPGQREGCLCEYIMMPARNCYPLPDHLSLPLGMMAEPVSVGIYATRLMSFSRPEAVGIFGVGPIGLSVLLALREKGIGALYATDKLERRLKMARQFGAHYTGNPGAANISEDVEHHIPALFDAVFECCGQQDALDLAVRLLKPGGELLIAGIPEMEHISFDISVLRRKELTIKNVRRQNGCTHAALDIIARERTMVESMITHHFPLEKSGAAFDLVAAYGDNCVKAMIQIDDDKESHYDG